MNTSLLTFCETDYFACNYIITQSNSAYIFEKNETWLTIVHHGNYLLPLFVPRNLIHGEHLPILLNQRHYSTYN